MDTPDTHPETPSLRDTFPALREAQSVYLGQIDSLQSPDRKTHELVRLACSVILRHPLGSSATPCWPPSSAPPGRTWSARWC